ncbi:uncharacterized protein LOC106471216 [Limulus polyphemus]|uniref:Uncharacterized protein LOC106471216 n=1 Tax=Limulus polyphemus TaxID=6850 RepID=A0ABM1BRI6_LIMPO|nr:uncharacterized protein LOC106471216 [Limulus polyphemus]
MENTTKGRDPHAVFAEIQNRVTAAGVSSRQLSKLKSIKILTKKKHSKKVSISNTWRVWAVIAAITSGVFLYFGLHTREGFSRLWFYLENTNPSNEFCTLDVPALVQNAFMPPVDCNICRNLTRVEKISKITPLEFESRFAYKGVPVVITDAMTNWTAPEVFNFTFFKSLYSFEGLQHECQFFPYQTEFKNLSEVFTMNMERALMLDKSNPWYVGWSNCDPIVSSTLRKYYNRPYFLPEDSEGSTLDWIFIGAPGYGANMHIDHVVYPSWQAQIKGRKLWTLEPAPECFTECRTLEVTIETGEIFVLDTNMWYHKTLIVGDEMSITIGSEYD